MWDSGQFHQQDGHVTAILDLELGHIGDPMMDLAAFRMRDTVLGFGDMNVLYDQYAKHAGTPVDIAAIMHHHFAFALTNQLVFHAALARTAGRIRLHDQHAVGQRDEPVRARRPRRDHGRRRARHRRRARSRASRRSRTRTSTSCVRCAASTSPTSTSATSSASRSDSRATCSASTRSATRCTEADLDDLRAVPRPSAGHVAGGRRRARRVRARRRAAPTTRSCCSSSTVGTCATRCCAVPRVRPWPGTNPSRSFVLDDFSRGPHRGLTLRAQGEGAQQDPHRIEARMTAVREPARYRRFRLIRGGERGHDHVIADPPPKLVLLSPASARWLPSLTEALGPSYRVVTESTETPAAVIVDSRDDELLQLIQEQRSTTRSRRGAHRPPVGAADGPVGAARPRRRHLPGAGVAPGTRRAREGLDQILGRVPAPSRGAGRVTTATHTGRFVDLASPSRWPTAPSLRGTRGRRGRRA